MIVSCVETRNPGLSDREDCMIPSQSALSEYQHVNDGQINRRLCFGYTARLCLPHSTKMPSTLDCNMAACRQLISYVGSCKKCLASFSTNSPYEKHISSQHLTAVITFQSYVHQADKKGENKKNASNQPEKYSQKCLTEGPLRLQCLRTQQFARVSQYWNN